MTTTTRLHRSTLESYGQRVVAARASSSSSSSRVEDENDDFAMKKTRRDNKERTMEPSSSQTFCAVSRCSASREAHATTNGDSIRENIFFIQFARTVRSCTNHATFRVDECDDDQRCAISAQYGDVYLARDDDVSLHRFLVVSRTKKKRRRKRRKRRCSEFHSAREAHQRRRHRWKRRRKRKQQLEERTVHERPET